MHHSAISALLTGVLTASVLVATAACVGDRDPVSNEADVTRVRDADRSVEITWTCSSNKPDQSGLNSQEEYCEWTRRNRTVDGKLQCDFNTSFDATRPFSLTMNERSGQFPATFANSQQFLVGGTEPTGERRVGLVPACVASNGTCVAPDCVCGRKSDPQICATLGAFARNRCTPELVTSPQKTAGVPKAGQEPNPIVAVQLQIPRPLARNCFYKNQQGAGGVDVPVPGVDPAVEKTYVRCFFDNGVMPNIARCDDVAKSLTVATQVRAKDASCNFSQLKTDLDGQTPDACH